MLCKNENRKNQKTNEDIDNITTIGVYLYLRAVSIRLLKKKKEEQFINR